MKQPASPHCVLMTIVLMMGAAKRGRSDNNCAELEFVNLRKDFILTPVDSDVNITFALKRDKCSPISELFVTISRTNNGNSLDECKFSFTSVCSVSAGSTFCRCMSDSGPLAFLKRFSRVENVTYLWSWREKEWGTKQKLISILVVDDDGATPKSSQRSINHIIILGTAFGSFAVIAVVIFCIVVISHRKRVRRTDCLPPPPAEWPLSDQRLTPPPARCSQKKHLSMQYEEVSDTLALQNI